MFPLIWSALSQCPPPQVQKLDAYKDTCPLSWKPSLTTGTISISQTFISNL